MKSWLLALYAAWTSCGGRPAAPPIAPATRQLIVGVADGWDARQVTLALYQRASASSPWRRQGRPWPGVIGSGLGWGRGLHGEGAPPGQPGPLKREGDGRAPAGVFALAGAYGEHEAPPGTRLLWTRLAPSLRCVDDPRSRHYGEVLDDRTVTPDWSSAEDMLRPDGLHRIVLVIAHNPRAEPGGGSCIFFHVWSSPEGATVGCTAMALSALAGLAATLDPAAQPRYLLLPRDRYRALAAAWQLPPLGD